MNSQHIMPATKLLPRLIKVGAELLAMDISDPKFQQTLKKQKKLMNQLRKIQRPL